MGSFLCVCVITVHCLSIMWNNSSRSRINVPSFRENFLLPFQDQITKFMLHVPWSTKSRSEILGGYESTATSLREEFLPYSIDKCSSWCQNNIPLQYPGYMRRQIYCRFSFTLKVTLLQWGRGLRLDPPSCPGPRCRPLIPACMKLLKPKHKSVWTVSSFRIKAS